MSDDLQPYIPSRRFDSQNVLYGNHYRFHVEALPDLTFFVQTFTLPSVSTTVVKRSTPFATIPEVADHLDYSTFDVHYMVDAGFKTYSSLYWWMKGYGFPHSYDEVAEFQRIRAARTSNPRPIRRELEKTSATLYLLQPDTDKSIAEIRFTDVFPVALGQLEFTTQATAATELKTTVSFACTEFDIILL